MAGKMQQEHVIRPTFQEQLFDLRLDDMCGLVTDYLYSELANLRVAEHSPERLGVGPGGQQVTQCLLLVLIAGNDQGFPLAAHGAASPVVCLRTNSSISRS
jgi:hypothetical protein